MQNSKDLTSNLIEVIKTKVEDFIYSYNDFITQLNPYRWDNNRVEVETDKLLRLIEEGKVRGDDLIGVPYRWNKTSNSSLSNRSYEFVKRPQPSYLYAQARIKRMDELMHSYPMRSLFVIGSGRIDINPVDMHWAQTILIDPIYKVERNFRYEEQGFIIVGEEYTPEKLSEYGAYPKAIVLDFVCHHFPNWKNYIDTIFQDPTVKCITISEYDLGDQQDNFGTLLQEIQTLFPTIAEIREIYEMGIADFLKLHSQPIVEYIMKLAQKYRFNFKIRQYFHKIDPQLDDVSGLGFLNYDQEKEKLFTQGTKIILLLERIEP